MMQLITRCLLVLCACLLLACQLTPVSAYAVEDTKDNMVERQLVVDILEELADSLRGGGSNGASRSKRPYDLGYRSRYGVAQSVGSKLMALKQAADWNGPGRRKREIEA